MRGTPGQVLAIRPMPPYAHNLRRLMARQGMTLRELVIASGLHERTVKAALGGNNKPHPRTLHRLAVGLGVSSDELFQNPSALAHHSFDRHTNPVVQEVIQHRPEWFDGWTDADLPLSYQRISSVANMGDAVLISS